jgi:hypothetical protein
MFGFKDKKPSVSSLTELYAIKELMLKQMPLVKSHETRLKLLRWVGRLEAKISKEKVG